VSNFESHLHDRLAAVRRNPSDNAARTALEQWIDGHPAAFQAWLPHDVLSFGISDAKLPRRLQFIKRLLLAGYAPPRVEMVSGADWQDATVNMAVVTSYFYANALSLLEAAQTRTDVAVFVTYPANNEEQPWLEMRSGYDGTSVVLHAALMLDAQGLVLRWFAEPVPVHYLFPVDNYYRSKFRLVTEYGASRVPMPGSALLREVCENKLLLADVIGSLPELRLAHELSLIPQQRMDVEDALDRFCAEHDLQALVTKPVDAFGGIGVEFWHYPQDRQLLVARLKEAVAANTVMLVQERIVPVPLMDGREWNLRQYVLRYGPELIRAPWKRARVGEGAVNTTQGAQSMTVEQLLLRLRIEPAQHNAFREALQRCDALAVEVLQRLDAYMQRFWNTAREPYIGSGSNLEPDLLALDFMISHDQEHPQQFVIYINEINDFASGGMRDYEILAHRQAFPDAERIVAAHPFSLAPSVLDLAKWRGSAYRQARSD